MRHEPIAYVYDADIHCPTCAEDRFGRDRYGFIAGEGSFDCEGNGVGVVAPWDEVGETDMYCGTCGAFIASADIGTD